MEGNLTKQSTTKAIIYRNLFKPEAQWKEEADSHAKNSTPKRSTKRSEGRKGHRHRRTSEQPSRKRGVTREAHHREAETVVQKVPAKLPRSASTGVGISGTNTTRFRSKNNKDFEISNHEKVLPKRPHSYNFAQKQEFGATKLPPLNGRKANVIIENKCNLGPDTRKRGKTTNEYREARKLVRGRAVTNHKDGLDRHKAQKAAWGFKILKLEIRWQNAEQEFYVRNSYDYDGDNRITLFRSPYTTVGKFEDTNTGKVLAIKQIHNADKYVEEIVNEVLILRYLNGIDRKHKYYPELYDAWHDERRDTVYLALEYFRYDLEQVLTKMRRRKVTFDRKRLRFFMWKMLLSVDILHRANILHRDLKPQNILVLEKLTGIRLIDYGSACCLRPTDRSLTQDRYTYGHIPMEVAAGTSYRYKADIFALGCIWWEMLHKGERLIKFQGNINSRRQQLEDNLRQLVQIFGQPHDKYDWIHDKDMRELAEHATSTSNSRGKPFANLTDMTAKDVLTGMLKLNPDERWNLSMVINSPYFARYKRSEPPLKITTPFSRPKTRSKRELWELLEASFQDFHRIHISRCDGGRSGVAISSRFQTFTI